jgi:8-oxo-dGTP diphosphatase
LPGGFVEYGKETVEQALVREMKEETNLDIKPKKIIGVYSDPKRDPRGHTITIAFECEIIGGTYKAGDDAKNAKKIPLKEALTMKLAFDHSDIIKDYIKSQKSTQASVKKTSKSTSSTSSKKTTKSSRCAPK